MMRKYLKSSLRLLSFGLILASLWACKDQHVVIGQDAPPVAVYDINGNQLTLAAFKGHPFLVNFWSQNCGMCIVELRKFAAFHDKYPQPLRILAVNIDGQSDKLKKFLAKENYPFSVGIDQMKITGGRYNLVGTPTTYYADKNGKIQAKFESIIPDEELEKLFKG